MGLGQNGGVVLRAGLDVFDDLFDAVAGVLELSVERFVVMMAMILQALEQVLREVGSVACRITVSGNLLQNQKTGHSVNINIFQSKLHHSRQPHTTQML